MVRRSSRQQIPTALRSPFAPLTLGDEREWIITQNDGAQSRRIDTVREVQSSDARFAVQVESTLIDSDGERSTTLHVREGDAQGLLPIVRERLGTPSSPRLRRRGLAMPIALSVGRTWFNQTNMTDEQGAEHETVQTGTVIRPLSRTGPGGRMRKGFEVRFTTTRTLRLANGATYEDPPQVRHVVLLEGIGEVEIEDSNGQRQRLVRVSRRPAGSHPMSRPAFGRR